MPTIVILSSCPMHTSLSWNSTLHVKVLISSKQSQDFLKSSALFHLAIFTPRDATMKPTHALTFSHINSPI